MKSPVLMVMAGPNGSGKSTITSKYEPIGYYVNADEIQRHIGCDELTAAKIATNTREKLLSQFEDFTFETVLSTPRNLNLMERAKVLGYHVTCIYVLTVNPEINVARVKKRKESGGHDVPPEKVRERYRRAMTLFPKLLEICDELYVYDNTLDREEGGPQRIICKQDNAIQLIPGEVWTMEMLKSLCSGTYSPKNK